MSANDTATGRSSLEEFLADHPRMTGALFTLLLVASQAGTVAAGGGTYNGP